MDAWMIVLLVVALAAMAFGVWAAGRKKRTEDLRGRFGPEYQRTVEDKGNRRAAEQDLAARAERRDKLEIRPLEPAARDRFARRWTDVQTRFVDDPSGAVADADELVGEAMAARGYPVDDFEQRSSDVSVDHPRVVESYRDAHAISVANREGRAGTEDLRQAMVHYRALFDELLEPADRSVDIREPRRTEEPLR